MMSHRYIIFKLEVTLAKQWTMCAMRILPNISRLAKNRIAHISSSKPRNTCMNLNTLYFITLYHSDIFFSFNFLSFCGKKRKIIFDCMQIIWNAISWIFVTKELKVEMSTKCENILFATVDVNEFSVVFFHHTRWNEFHYKCY